MVDVDNYKLQTINSNIHNLNYLNKVLLFFFMSLFIIITDSSMDIFMVNLLLLVILSWSNIGFRMILKNIRIFGVFIFIVLFLISLISLNLYIGMFFTIKIIDFIVILSIIGMSTSYYVLIRGIRFLLRPIGFMIDINKMSIKFAGILKFMAVMYGEEDRILVSKRLRGVNYNSLGFVDKIDYILRELPLLIKYSINKIGIYRDNVYVNKYGIDSVKYKYRLNKWTKTDTIILIINLFMLFIVFVY